MCVLERDIGSQLFCAGPVDIHKGNRYKFKGSGWRGSLCKMPFIHFYDLIFLVYGLVLGLKLVESNSITLKSGKTVSNTTRKPPQI